MSCVLSMLLLHFISISKHCEALGGILSHNKTFSTILHYFEAFWGLLEPFGGPFEAIMNINHHVQGHNKWNTKSSGFTEGPMSKIQPQMPFLRGQEVKYEV